MRSRPALPFPLLGRTLACTLFILGFDMAAARDIFWPEPGFLTQFHGAGERGLCCFHCS
jgi:hypothetical protein